MAKAVQFIKSISSRVKVFFKALRRFRPARVALDGATCWSRTAKVKGFRSKHGNFVKMYERRWMKCGVSKVQVGKTGLGRSNPAWPGVCPVGTIPIQIQ